MRLNDHPIGADLLARAHDASLPWQNKLGPVRGFGLLRGAAFCAGRTTWLVGVEMTYREEIIGDARLMAHIKQAERQSDLFVRKTPVVQEAFL